MNPSDQARQVGVVDSWLAEISASGYVVNPGNDYALCVTPQLAAGWYDVMIFSAANCQLGSGNLTFERRDPLNQSTYWSFGVCHTAYNTFAFTLTNLKVVAQDTFRWYIYWGFTGVILCTILAIRRA